MAPGSEGMAFGNTETWQGLAVILDSFDNNGLVSLPLLPWQPLLLFPSLQHDNPKIMAVTNDGMQRFDHSRY